MKISTLFYCFKQGIRNVFRNKWFSLASVATIAACLFLFGLFYSILENFQYMVKNAETNVCVSALLDGDISEERIREIQTILDKRVEVKHAEYVSAEDTWAQFIIDNNMEEAAQTMGAKGARILLKIILPVILPSVVSVAALNFNALLGDYDLSVFLYSPKFQPLGVIIQMYSSDGADLNGRAMTLVYSVMLMILSGVALWLTQGDGVQKIKELVKKNK